MLMAKMSYLEAVGVRRKKVEVGRKNGRIGEEADTGDEGDFGMEPGELCAVDFGQGGPATFRVVIRPGLLLLVYLLLVGDLVDGGGRRGLFLDGFTHFERRIGGSAVGDQAGWVSLGWATRDKGQAEPRRSTKTIKAIKANVSSEQRAASAGDWQRWHISLFLSWRDEEYDERAWMDQYRQRHWRRWRRWESAVDDARWSQWAGFATRFLGKTTRSVGRARRNPWVYQMSSRSSPTSTASPVAVVRRPSPSFVVPSYEPLHTSIPSNPSNPSNPPKHASLWLSLRE